MSKFIAYILIPVYTILFVGNFNWLDFNFTYIGNLPTRNEWFLIWGLIFGLYCFLAFDKIIKEGGDQKFERVTMTVAAVLLFCGVTTPYLPDEMPFQAILHVWFSFFAAIVIMLCMTGITIRLYKRDKKRYGIFLLWNIATIAVSAVLFVTVGMVSSALEIFFTLSFVFLLETLKGKV